MSKSYYLYMQTTTKPATTDRLPGLPDPAALKFLSRPDRWADPYRYGSRRRPKVRKVAR